MPVSKLINSFNSGEWSPLAWSRSDLEKYASGCKQLRNFIILPYGGVMRRPGTQYLGAAKHADRRCRLAGFNFSTTTNFILELGEGYLRFWSNGQPVESAPGEALELETPYLEADLRELQYVQINDIMYVVHPRHAPMKLSRLADDDWTFAPVAWDWPVLLDENVEETTIAPSGTSGTITLTASADIFELAHVGAYFSIAHRREVAHVEQALSATAASSALDVLGDWELTTYGNWDGRLQVQRSYDGGTNWETIRTYESGGERNVSSTGTEERAASLRLSYQADAAGSSSPKARLEAGDNRVYGMVKITGYTSPTSVEATVVKPLYAATATKVWAEGAFSDKRGYPRTVCLHEQRLIFGGSQHRPLSVWGSVVDDFENFRYTANNDGAFSFSLSANESNPINWMVSQGELLIGTAGNEWTLGSGSAEDALGPTTVQAQFQSSYGSKYLQARIVNEVVIFAQRQGRKFRELTYAFEKDGWVAPDLTILAEHVGRGEFVETAFQQQPDAIFWSITGDGRLVGMTYERQQQVVGWHSHDTQGEFESVATIYGGSGEDEVWFVVRRVVDGQTVRYIERLKADFRTTLEAGDKPNWWYLDCARQIVASEPESFIDGIGYLEGLGVGVLGDGAVQPDRTVEAGGISLQLAARKVLVGLPYESVLQPLGLDMLMQDGTAQGRKARVHRIVARVYKSLGGEYSTDGAAWDTIFARNISDVMDSSPPVFTGDKEVYTGSSWGDTADLLVRQNDPLPLCVLALIPKWDVVGE